MSSPIRILLQTTIPYCEDDWCIERFSLLRKTLESMTDDNGAPAVTVTARNRQPGDDGHDPVLASLDRTQFDQLWLFAVDTGDGLTPEEVSGIRRFHDEGGGLLTTRDHEDLGASLTGLGAIGAAHHFHSRNPEPDPERQAIDDTFTTTISWPNYHSGNNGDYQQITPADPAHELMRSPHWPDGLIHYLPAHPHEGAVGVPHGEPSARVVATGASTLTNRPFNIAVAFESVPDDAGRARGRAVADSSFHHFCDYNCDPDLGCPSFVTEPPGYGMVRDERARADMATYVSNIARWLGPANTAS
jgi:hypothetical protein